MAINQLFRLNKFPFEKIGYFYFSGHIFIPDQPIGLEISMHDLVKIKKISLVPADFTFVSHAIPVLEQSGSGVNLQEIINAERKDINAARCIEEDIKESKFDENSFLWKRLAFWHDNLVINWSHSNRGVYSPEDAIQKGENYSSTLLGDIRYNLTAQSSYLRKRTRFSAPFSLVPGHPSVIKISQSNV